MKKAVLPLLPAAFFLAMVAHGGDLPFEVGDTIGFRPMIKDQPEVQSALVKEIRGRWFFVDAKGGNSSWNCWYNSDQVQYIWIEKRGKKDGQK